MNFTELKAFWSEAGISIDTVFEQIIEEHYRRVLDPGDVAIDVGAHAGRHLFPLAEAVGPTGRVYGFEPLPMFCLELVQAAAAQQNVVVFPYALADQAAHCEITEIRNAPAYSGIRQREIFNQTVLDQLDVAKFPALQVPLDALLHRPDSVGFIRIDVEGGELDVLRGARGTLAASRPVVVFEHGWSAADTCGYTGEAFFGFFRETGFRLLDCRGVSFTEATSEAPWYLFAFPGERAEALTATLRDRVKALRGRLGQDRPGP